MGRRHTVGIASLVAAAGAGAVGGVLAGARKISGPQRPWPDYRFSTFEVGVPGEDISFAAADGFTISLLWTDMCMRLRPSPQKNHTNDRDAQ